MPKVEERARSWDGNQMRSPCAKGVHTRALARAHVCVCVSVYTSQLAGLSTSVEDPTCGVRGVS